MNHQVEPREKRRRSKKKKPTTPSFSLLPDEIAVNCLAQISRAHYPRFSTISKRFRSLLSSPDLYSVRSQIGSTEQCLYVCLSDKTYQYPRWFTLWIDPSGTLIKKKKKSLAPISSSDFPSVSQSSTLVVGSEIYIIGGPVNNTEPDLSRFSPSSAVRILDCRTHAWRDAPSMILARENALTCLHDGKIYVMGGCGVLEEPWAEVLDINTRMWKGLSDPGAEIRKMGNFNRMIKEMRGKIYFWSSIRTYAYDTNQDNWERFEGFQESRTCLVDGGVRYYRIPKSACVIDGVWYYQGHNRYLCRWTKDGGKRKGVKGLESLRKMYNRNGGYSGNTTKLVSCGGKLLLLWEGYMKHNPCNRKKIWCAEITLETVSEGEIWGKAEWIDVVQIVPTECELLHCLVVSV